MTTPISTLSIALDGADAVDVPLAAGPDGTGNPSVVYTWRGDILNSVGQLVRDSAIKVDARPYGQGAGCTAITLGDAETVAGQSVRLLTVTDGDGERVYLLAVDSSLKVQTRGLNTEGNPTTSRGVSQAFPVGRISTFSAS